MTFRLHFSLAHVLLPLIGLVALSVGWPVGCASDPYRDRTETIKRHVKSFYDHLQDGRVAAAITENERIEAIAAEAGAEMLRRGRPAADNRLDRDAWIVRTAHEAAAENWLALARYLSIKGRYSEARAAYQRVLSEYRDPGFRAFAEQARLGLKDLEILHP